MVFLNFILGAIINIAIGALLSGLFRPSQTINQEGPRLDDLEVTTSSYGGPIFEHYGNVATAGNIIWATDIKEVVKTTTRKVGPKRFILFGGRQKIKTTEYLYFGNFAISFGRSDGNAGLLKLYFDNKLVYDATGTSLKFSKIDNIRIYNGSETQTPDPLIVAEEGNAPAHRGLFSIVIEDYPLKDHGNGLPRQIRAELSFNPSDTGPFTELQLVAGAKFPGSASGADTDSFMMIDPDGDELYMFQDGTNGITRSSLSSMNMEAVNAGSAATLNPISHHKGMRDFVYAQLGSTNYKGVHVIDSTTMIETAVKGGNGSVGSRTTAFNFPNPSYFGQFTYFNEEQGVEPTDFVVVSFKSIVADSVTGGSANGGAAVYKGATLDTFEAFDTDIDIGTGGPVMVYRQGNRCFLIQESTTQVDLYEVVVRVSFSPAPLNPPLFINAEAEFDEFELVATFTKGGTHFNGTDDVDAWCFVVDDENPALILSNGNSMSRVTLNDGVITHTNLSVGFGSKDNWSTNGLFAFGDGKTTSGSDGELITISTADLTEVDRQNVNLSSFADSFTTNYQRSAYDSRNHSLIFSRLNGQAGVTDDFIVRVLLDRRDDNAITLSSILSDRLTRTGYAVGDIDVSATNGVNVRGVSVTRQSPERQIHESLQQAFIYDMIESDWKIASRLRGGSSVVTIPENELGLATGNENRAAVIEEELQDVDVPEIIQIQYADIDRNFERGNAMARRVASPTPTQFSRDTDTISLPVVFNATEAKQLAEKLLGTIWTERFSLSSSLYPRYMRLEPSDVVTVTVSGETKTIRMADITLGANRAIEFVSNIEDSQTYVSTIVGDGGSGSLTQIIPSGLPTRWFPLDIPLLASADATFQTATRLYWAASGYDDTWDGTQLFRQGPNENNFGPQGDMDAEVAWGHTTIAIADPNTVFTWDDVTTVTIQVRRGLSQFQSKTDLDILNGDNVLIVQKSDGTSEIIQFVNVNVNGDVVTLSRLLRGRAGTEPLSTGHTVGERCILLSEDTLQSFTMPTADINVAARYRAVTFENDFEDTKTEFFTTTGQDLIPYSVAELESNLKERLAGTETDMVVTWTRRTRFSGEEKGGTGTVPINEQEEKYEVDIIYDGVIIATKIVTSPTVSFTLAEWTALVLTESPTLNRLTGELLVENRDFELGTLGSPPTGWDNGVFPGEKVSSLFESSTGETTLPQTGSFFLAMITVSAAEQENYQDIDLAALGYDVETLDINQPTVDLKVYANAARDAHDDLIRVMMEFRDSSGSVLSNLDTGWVDLVQDTWTEQNLNGSLPVGTRKIRIRLRGQRAGAGLDSPEVAFDNLRLTLGAGVPPLTINVHQISGIVDRGRVATIIA